LSTSKNWKAASLLTLPYPNLTIDDDKMATTQAVQVFGKKKNATGEIIPDAF